MLVDKNTKQVMLDNVEIKRIMSEGGVLWEKNTAPKPKLSWLSSDTSTYVEEFNTQSLGTSYRMKSNFIDNNKIGMWVYKVEPGEIYNVVYGTYITGIDIKMPPNGVSTTDGGFLMFSNNLYDKYKEPITNFFYGFSKKTPIRRIYYYEYPKDISKNEYEEIKKAIVETL